MRKRFLDFSFFLAFIVSIFGLGIFASQATFANHGGSPSSTYNYIDINTDNGDEFGACSTYDEDPADGRVLGIREVVPADPNTGSNSEGTFIWCLQAGSGFTFERFGNPSEFITVDGSTPGSVVRGNLGAAQGGGITIGNSSVFGDFFTPEEEEEQSNPDIDETNEEILAREQECIDSGGTFVPDSQACIPPEPDPDSVPPSCLNEGGDNSWLICPALNGLDGAISYLDNQVNSLLFLPEAYYNDENQQLERVWSSFRDIAYLLLIPIMLVMVIGTALGFSFVDAYTVKRAMPRLFVAVIFIAISLPLLRILVTTVSVVGQGLYGLISSVGSNSGESFSLQGLFDPNPLQDSGASILVIAGGAVVIKFLLPFLLLLGLAVLLQIATIFILLAFRQFLIIALMVVAPLAILAWIFPGNDKLWKLWWGSFWKLLLLYPLIMALLAIGRVFSEIVQGAPGSQGLVEVIIKLVAYIGPFFLIPTAFKFAGGVFANVGGMVNDRERGVFDRLRKGRQKSLSDKHQGAMDGTGKQGKGVVGGLYRRGANLGKNGSLSPTKAGRGRWNEQEKLIKEAAADKKLKEGGNRAFNDDDTSDLLRQKGMTSSKFIKDYAKNDVGVGKRFATEADRTKGAQEALARAELATGAKVGTDTMRVAAQKFRTSMTNTAYEPGEAGLEQLQDDLMEMQNDGLISTADAAGWMKANKSRPDYSSNGFNDTIKFASKQITARQQIQGAFEGADPREIVGGHQRAVETFAEQAKFNLEAAVAGGDVLEIDRALADTANIQDTLNSISRKKGEKFATEVFGQGFGGDISYDVDKASGVQRPSNIGPPDPATTDRIQRKMTYRELLEQRRNSKDYLDRRREYSTQQAAAASGGEAPPDPA